MSPPGEPHEWSSADYFDDDGIPEKPIRNVRDLRAAVRKCVATAARSQRGLGILLMALSRAAARLERLTVNNQDLLGATADLRNAAEVLKQAQVLIRQAEGKGTNYLSR